MGRMKEMAMDISYSLGLDGDITPDVIHIAFEQGKLCKKVCAWCNETLGYIKGSGITHGICEKCAEEVKKQC